MVDFLMSKPAIRERAFIAQVAANMEDADVDEPLLYGLKRREFEDACESALAAQDVSHRSGSSNPVRCLTRRAVQDALHSVVDIREARVCKAAGVVPGRLLPIDSDELLAILRGIDVHIHNSGDTGDNYGGDEAMRAMAGQVVTDDANALDAGSDGVEDEVGLRLITMLPDTHLYSIKDLPSVISDALMDHLYPDMEDDNLEQMAQLAAAGANRAD
jgi:hypothetical protein